MCGYAHYFSRHEGVFPPVDRKNVHISRNPRLNTHSSEVSRRGWRTFGRGKLNGNKNRGPSSDVSGRLPFHFESNREKCIGMFEIFEWFGCTAQAVIEASHIRAALFRTPCRDHIESRWTAPSSRPTALKETA